MADKTTPKIGTILSETPGRDAIHIAVAPVVAAEHLDPGQRVGLDDNGKAKSGTDSVGIVDPFLTKPVKPGQMFYLFLYPNTITSLRHEWVHPAFPEISPEQVLDAIDGKDRRVIQEVADIVGISYRRMMETATGHYETGDYENMGNNEGYNDVGNWTEFWEAWSRVTGKPLSEAHSKDLGSFFSCAC